MIYLFVLSVLFTLANLLMLIRNNRVCAFRKSVINAIYEADLNNTRTSSGYEWRYQRFNSVSYDKMLWNFWKPLTVEAFYQNQDFILPNRVLA